MDILYALYKYIHNAQYTYDAKLAACRSATLSTTQLHTSTYTTKELVGSIVHYAQGMALLLFLQLN